MHLHDLSRFAFVAALLPLLAARADASTTYCTAAPNSVGAGAHIQWSGPESTSSGGLVATGLPASSAGFFWYSTSAAQTPFGDGFSCVGAPAWILARKPASPQGAIALRLALEAESDDLRWLNDPTNQGVTWRFQYVYRDPAGPGGTGFNTTDGVAVVLGP
jgi:hypothetical protein